MQNLTTLRFASRAQLREGGAIFKECVECFQITNGNHQFEQFPLLIEVKHTHLIEAQANFAKYATISCTQKV